MSLPHYLLTRLDFHVIASFVQITPNMKKKSSKNSHTEKLKFLLYHFFSRATNNTNTRSNENKVQNPLASK